MVLVLPSACSEPASTLVPAPSTTPTLAPSGNRVQAPPAKFEVSVLSISSTVVPVNQPVTVSVDVSNIGGTEGTYSLTMTIDGIKAETKVIRVAPESTQKVSFLLVTDKPGIHKVEINELSGIFQVFKPADFTTSNLVITPTVAEVGQTVIATVEISNIGGIEDNYPVTLRIAGVQTETKDITIGPGVTETASFTFTRDTPGCYEIEVAGLTGQLIVIEPGGTLAEMLKTTWPELFQELQLLPELKETDMKDNEVIEDIAYLALNPEYRPAFESMLMIGIKGQRKYCTPLQALLWIAYDREFDEYNPLIDYSLEKLINDAWKNTTMSQNYTSDRWEDFDEVADRLNSPMLIATYMGNNFSYIADFYIFQPAERSFKIKGGACSDRGMFGLELLMRSGYEYNDFEVHKNNAAAILVAFEGRSTFDRTVREKGWGHVVTLYVKDGLFYTIDMRQIRGPFDAIEDAARATYPNWGAYEIRDIHASVTKKVKRAT